MKNFRMTLAASAAGASMMLSGATLANSYDLATGGLLCPFTSASNTVGSFVFSLANISNDTVEFESLTCYGPTGEPLELIAADPENCGGSNMTGTASCLDLSAGTLARLRTGAVTGACPDPNQTGYGTFLDDVSTVRCIVKGEGVVPLRGVLHTFDPSGDLIEVTEAILTEQ